MRYITKRDEEIIDTINLACHFPDRAEIIRRELENSCRVNTKSAEAAFAYGLFLLCSQKNTSVTGMHNLDSETMLAAFHKALKLVPDYWLVQIFKIIVLLSLPEIMRPENELVESLENIISQQEQADRKEPYFIISYVMFADYKYSCSDRPGALDILRKGIRAVPQIPIKHNCLYGFFTVPFKDYMKRLLRSNDLDMVNQVRDLGKKYFPDEKIFNNDFGQEWL